MQSKKNTIDRSAVRHIVRLGKAKDLTRAETQGNHAEIIGDRLYSVGG